MRALIPYAGSGRTPHRPGTVIKIQGPPPKLTERLRSYSEDRALDLFSRGNDTVAIATLLECTPAAAANGLARARDRERGQ